MAINDSFLQELRYKSDIEDIISQYVQLKARGRTSIALCPFHNEKTPSFNVYKDTQSFYCFGCGAGGDVITFIKRAENLDYIDALKFLAQRANMAMPDDGYDDSISKERFKVLEANRAAARFFHEALYSPDGHEGLKYLYSRNLTDATIKHFGLGFAPDNWDSLLRHLKSEGFTTAQLLAANLIKQSSKGSYYDNFRNRTITPIIDKRGNVIAFGGRVLDNSKPKYINTADTLVYKKTNELFALNFAKKSGESSLILCEGYMDVITMHQAGFTNAIAACGTALTHEQVMLIANNCDEVVLCYDADEAGQKALYKAISLFESTSVKVRVPRLTGGKDPDEIINTLGRDKFKGILQGAANDVEFQILNIKQRYDLQTTDGKISFLNEVIKLLAKLTPIEKDIYVSKLAEELAINPQSIKTQLDDYTAKTQRREKYNAFKQIVTDSAPKVSLQTPLANSNPKLTKAMDRLLTLLLSNSELVVELSKLQIDAMLPAHKKVIEAVIKVDGENRAVNIATLRDFLSDEEIALVARLHTFQANFETAREELIDCIDVINAEHDKTKQPDLTNMSDDDFRNLFNKN